MQTTSSPTSSRRSRARRATALAIWLALSALLVLAAFYGQASEDTGDDEALYDPGLRGQRALPLRHPDRRLRSRSPASFPVPARLGFRRFRPRWVWIGFGVVVATLVLAHAPRAVPPRRRGAGVRTRIAGSPSTPPPSSQLGRRRPAGALRRGTLLPRAGRPGPRRLGRRSRRGRPQRGRVRARPRRSSARSRRSSSSGSASRGSACAPRASGRGSSRMPATTRSASFCCVRPGRSTRKAG